MKTGDKVFLKFHPNKYKGIIKAVMAVDLGEEYLVDYDEDGLIPPEDWHPENELALVSEGKSLIDEFELKLAEEGCSCGASALGYGKGRAHSDWCDLEGKFDDN